MMDSRVKTYTVQHQDGLTTKHLSYREAMQLLKQAKNLGVHCSLHPELTTTFKPI